MPILAITSHGLTVKSETMIETIFIPEDASETATTVNNHNHLSLTFVSNNALNIVKLKILQKTDEIKICTVIEFLKVVIVGDLSIF